MTFARQLEHGKAAESAIARWLMARGHSVLPVYEKIIDEGKGPQLFSSSGPLIAPDILTMRNGSVLWIEAKHKSAFSWHRLTQKFVTGIDIRHYDDYLKVAETTTFPLWILFLHEGGTAIDSPASPAGLYGSDIAALRNGENHRSHRWGRSGMVYWSRTCDGGPLKMMAPIEDFQAAAPAPLAPMGASPPARCAVPPSA